MTLLTALIVSLFYGIAQSDYHGRLCGSNWGEVHFDPDSDDMTIVMCINFCTDKRYLLAGLIHGRQCFCNNTVDPYIVCNRNNENNPECAKCPASKGEKCHGDNSTICGDEGWYSLYDAGVNSDLIHNCDTTAAEMCSAYGGECKVRCSLDSINDCFNGYNVWGTEHYRADSSLCLAAQHDFRLLPGSSDPVNVTIKRATNFLQLEGSWRFGVNTGWSDTADIFSFTGAQLPLSQYDPVYAILDPIEAKVRCVTKQLQPGYELILFRLDNNVPLMKNSTSNELESSVERNLLVYCGLYNGQAVTDSFVPVVWPTDFSQHSMTHTVPLGSSTEVKFNNTSALDLQLWKNQKSLRNQTGTELIYPIPKTTVSSTGFYELRVPSMQLSSFTRLIIDASGITNFCAHRGKLNPNGDSCICLPPFKGYNCTDTCDLGHFGTNCDYTCNGDLETNCRGQVICGPDTLGCHCASGWTAPNCTQECVSGTYGPDCLEFYTCHCSDGGCDRFYGNCPKGCEPGYYGDRCDLEHPYMKTPPKVNAVHYNSVTIMWNLWNNAVDGGDIGPPDMYQMGYKINDWTTVNVSNNNCDSQGCYGSVDSLDAHTTVTFRIGTVYNNTVSPHYSPELQVTTACEKPTVSPSNLNVKIVGNKTSVVWDSVSKDSLKCDAGTVVVTMSCDSCEGSSIISNTVDYTINSVDVQPMPGGICTFSAHLSNAEKQDGPESSSISQQIAETPPGAVGDLHSYELPNGNVLLVWEKPEKQNGKISTYEVTITEVVPKLFRREIVMVEANKTLLVDDTFVELNNSDFKQGVTYNVQVVGNNGAGGGQPATATFKNPIVIGSSTPIPTGTAPSGAPESTTAKSNGSSDDSLSPEWIAIICLLIIIVLLAIVAVVLLVKWHQTKKELARESATPPESASYDVTTGKRTNYSNPTGPVATHIEPSGQRL